MKKSISVLLTAVVTVSLLTGCGSSSGNAASETTAVTQAGSSTATEAVSSSTAASGGNTASGKITVVVNEDQQKYFEEVAKGFNEEYPDVQLEYVSFPDLTTLNQGIQAAHQAGDDYDILTVNHVDMMTYVKAGMLYPLSDLADKDGVTLDDIFMGSLLKYCKTAGKTYTIPFDTDTRVMAVNKDLFDKYGLSVPETMDDMLTCGEKMTQNGDYLFANPLTGSAYQSTYEMGVFLQSCGGQLYTVDDNGKATATIDTKEMRDYLNFVTKLMKYMPEDAATTKDARSQFCNGNIGMYIFGPWEYSQELMQPDKLGFNMELELIPSGAAGHVSTSGGWQLGIASGTDNLDASWAFFKYITSHGDAMSILGESGLPTIESAYETGTFADQKYDIFKEQLKTSNMPQVPVANLGEVVNCFDEYWQNLLFGKMTVDEVCTQAQPAVQKLLDENN